MPFAAVLAASHEQTQGTASADDAAPPPHREDTPKRASASKTAQPKQALPKASASPRTGSQRKQSQDTTIQTAPEPASRTDADSDNISKVKAPPHKAKDDEHKDGNQASPTPVAAVPVDSQAATQRSRAVAGVADQGEPHIPAADATSPPQTDTPAADKGSEGTTALPKDVPQKLAQQHGQPAAQAKTGASQPAPADGASSDAKASAPSGTSDNGDATPTPVRDAAAKSGPAAHAEDAGTAGRTAKHDAGNTSNAAAAAVTLAGQTSLQPSGQAPAGSGRVKDGKAGVASIGALKTEKTNPAASRSATANTGKTDNVALDSKAAAAAPRVGAATADQADAKETDKRDAKAESKIAPVSVKPAANVQSQPHSLAATHAAEPPQPAANANAQTAMTPPMAAPTHAAAQVTASLHVAAQTTHPVPASDHGQLAVAIAAHSLAGTKHFDIALHPQDMGSIQVHLSVAHNGAAQAHITADNQQTLQLLQGDSHHLERALKDAGLNLAGGGLNFSLKGQQQQSGGGQSGARANFRNLSVTAIASTAGAQTSNDTYSLAPDSVRLDIRV